MADPSYHIMGAGIHSFLMFAPFLALYEKKGMIVQGLFLYFFGPILASWITPNLQEQASIWCFFSIAQISTMLFLIRETLIIEWGRNKSVFSSSKNEIEYKFCRDFLHCEHCKKGKEQRKPGEKASSKNEDTQHTRSRSASKSSKKGKAN